MAVDLTFKPFRVNPKALHEFIIMPMFSDIIGPQGTVTQPSPEEGDWSIMDDVIWRRPIIELTGNQNVLKRRDATCKLIYSPIGKLGSRYIFTEPLYAAVEDCIEEFYQGCFIDFEQGNYDMIFENLMPILEKAVATDIYTNKYFGDVTRAADPTGTWSWNKFDGVFTHLSRYIADGVLPAEQAIEIPVGDITPQVAHDILEDVYNAQTFAMRTVDMRDKAFYVDWAIADAYWDWLVLAGQSTISERQDGRPSLRFRGIEIRPKFWDGILAALNGGDEAHIVLLSLKGNWLYATDSSYGGGPRRNEAVRVWYSMDDNVWRRQIHLKAGTEWVNPQYVVLAMTEI
jgi:hypothetical protein